MFRLIFALSVLSSVALAASLNLKTANGVAPGGYLIWQGDCDNVTNTSLVSADHVDLVAIPFYKRDHTTEWHGDKVVTCVSVLSLKGNTHPGTANITKGGYGHSFVTIYMESERGYSIEFQVNIYAK